MLASSTGNSEEYGGLVRREEDKRHEGKKERMISSSNDRIKLIALIGCCFMIVLNLYSIQTLTKYQEQQHHYLEQQQQEQEHSNLRQIPKPQKDKKSDSGNDNKNRPEQPPPSTVNDNQSRYQPDQRNPSSSFQEISSENPWISTQYQLIMDEWKNVRVNATKVMSLKSPKPLNAASNGDDITITAHLGVSKLNRFQIMIERWKGPISAAVYITSPSEIQTLLEFQYSQNEPYPSTSFQILLDQSSGFYKGAYPYNVLRQLALDSVATEYFLTMDVDFVTTTTCHQSLVDKLPQLESALKDETLMVLPAFERAGKEIQRTTNQDVDEDWIVQHYQEVLPDTKTDLVREIHLNRMIQFHGEFTIGHGSTDYKRWFSGVSDSNPYYYIDYQVKYEPYILGRKTESLTKYWQGFHTYHYNKYSWFMELYFDGYEFAVLTGDEFVIHLEHKYPPKQQMLKPELNKFRSCLKNKYNWDQQTMSTVISKRMNYAEPPYEGPSNIPKLVGWKEQNGMVFGRIFWGDIDNKETDLAYVESKEFIGTGKIIDGQVAVNNTVVSKSGHRYYLSSESLVRR